MDNVEAKRGLRFYHARVLDTQKWDGISHQLFVVTCIKEERVYIAPVYGSEEREWLGCRDWVEKEKFKKIVMALT